MNECRQCGAPLPPKKSHPEALRLARKNVEYFTSLLREEGALMPVDQERTSRRILYESELMLKGEYSVEEAICKRCRGS